MNHPILMAVELSNGHFMSCRLLHPDRHTLPSLNRWHQHLLHVIKLVELGDLHYLRGPQAFARHRNWGDPWIDHQPRFSPSWNPLKALARSLKVETLFIHTDGQWHSRRPFDR